MNDDDQTTTAGDEPEENEEEETEEEETEEEETEEGSDLPGGDDDVAPADATTTPDEKDGE